MHSGRLEPAALSPIGSPRQRLLIVDDQADTRNWLTETLLEAGYQVDQAADGKAALAKLSTAGPYQGIVLDLLMPDVNGWQFREAALRQPELARIPVVVVTVRPLREPDRYVLRTPYILQKPCEPTAIVSMVRYACTTGMRCPEREAAPAIQADLLYWSRRGEVACAVHAPDPRDDRWRDERWTPIPTYAGKGRVIYQCQRCAPTARPMRHRRARETPRGHS